MDIASSGGGYRASAVASFEAAVLVRCTGVCGGSRARALGGARARTALATSGVLAEFNRSDAAGRLVALLRAAGHSASLQSYTAGNRHRYDIHRVLTGRGTEQAVHNAWQAGYTELCAHPTQPRSARQARHARLLASAAWRAALLVCSPARSGSPGLRVADLDTATALVRAGRMLDLPVRMSTRPGGQLLLVLPADATVAA